ncbi:MAG: two-component regulator propeller domain-containing protein [Bacteroidota bacterium]
MIKQVNALFFAPLYIIIFLLLFLGCKNDNKGNATIESKKQNSIPPITIQITNPRITYLADCPPPQTIVVPTHNQTIILENKKVLNLTPSVVKSFNSNGNSSVSVEGQGIGFFTNYNTEQGLALSAISCGLKDKMGNLWFGTLGAGVSRYDGKDFITFNTSSGLVHNGVFCITEDKKGNLWFGTNGGGASCYDGKSFTTYSMEQGLPSNTVLSIVGDKSGNIWFGTNEGVSCYNGKNIVNLTSKDGLADNRVSSIAEDNSGNLWFATYNSGVSRYDGKIFTTFTTQQGLVHNGISCITKDRNGNLWFGSTGHGMSRYNGKSFTNFLTDEREKTNIWSITEDKSGNIWFRTGVGVTRYDGKHFVAFTTDQGLSHNDVRTITEDRNGNLWFGTGGGGVCMYTGKAFISFTGKQGLPNDLVKSIMEDKNGNLWFGTHGFGVCRYDGKSFTTFTTEQGLEGGRVWSMLEDKSGNLWFGKLGGGASCYNGKFFTTFTTEQGLADNNIRCLCQDKGGNIWFGTSAGVSRYDGKSVTTYTTANGLPENNIKSIIEDNDGNLWIGTNGGGVLRYDGKYFTNYTTAQGLSNNTILNTLKDSGGNLWFGTNGGGVSRYDGKSFISFTLQEGLADNVVYDMEEDRDGTIWFGTNLGFSGLKFRNLKNGSQETRGAGTININNEELKNYVPVWEIYNKKNGYPVKDLNTNAMCITKIGLSSSDSTGRVGTGIIWAGCGDNKLIRFDPSAINKNSEKPIIVIQNIKIQEENISWYTISSDQEDKKIVAEQEISTFGKYLSEQERDTIRRKFADIKFDSIRKWYPLPENLILSYDHNNVTFDFLAIETDRNFLVRYQYMLEGYDNNWSSSTDKTTATFGNINEGDYVFKVKARSPFGIWSEPVIYSFKVLPPWYRTWWAYSIYIFAASFFLYGFYRLRTASLRRDKELLEQTVKERTSEVEKKTMEVEKKAAEIEKQKQIIEQKNQKITDSINYAKNIQDSLLLSEEEIHIHLPELFIYYRPKDIVSGDFYWFSKLDDKLIVAVADCTGHGVPGAFMSMIGNMLLNEIVNDLLITDPGLILNKLHLGIYKSLQQSHTEERSQDGMDISICVIDKPKGILEFAGAQNSLYISVNGALQIIKADLNSIGGKSFREIDENKKFTTHVIPIVQGMNIYMLTDGYTDQFGGAERKKLGSAKFKAILSLIADLPSNEQKKIIHQKFEDWKTTQTQIDDVLLVGFKI